MDNSVKATVSKGCLVVGTVIPYASNINAGMLDQQGWLYCDGTAVSRTTYAELFSVIGTLHGGGDGQSTFNLPDYRGYFLRGVDDGEGVDPDADLRTAPATGGSTGDNCGSVQGFATMAPTNPFTMSTDGDHTHTIGHIPNDNSSYAIAGDYQAIWNGGSANTNFAGNHKHNIIGGDKESRPENAYVNYVIKYRSS